MRCPKCEKKLGTLRTTCYGHKTLRERKCTKCKTTLPTIELYEKDYNNEISSLKHQLTAEKNKSYELGLDMERLRNAITTLLNFAGRI